MTKLKWPKRWPLGFGMARCASEERILLNRNGRVGSTPVAAKALSGPGHPSGLSHIRPPTDLKHGLNYSIISGNRVKHFLPNLKSG